MKYLLISLKSWYSFRNGVDSPASLAAALAEKGFQGGVLADRDVVTGQLEFAAVCNKDYKSGWFITVTNADE